MDWFPSIQVILHSIIFSCSKLSSPAPQVSVALFSSNMPTGTPDEKPTKADEKPKVEPQAAPAAIPEGLKEGTDGKTKVVPVDVAQAGASSGTPAGTSETPEQTGDCKQKCKVLMSVSTVVLAASIAIPLIAQTCCREESQVQIEPEVEKEEDRPSLYELLKTLIGKLGFSSDDNQVKPVSNTKPNIADDENNVADYAVTQSM